MTDSTDNQNIVIFGLQKTNVGGVLPPGTDLSDLGDLPEPEPFKGGVVGGFL